MEQLWMQTLLTTERRPPLQLVARVHLSVTLPLHLRSCNAAAIGTSSLTLLLHDLQEKRIVLVGAKNGISCWKATTCSLEQPLKTMLPPRTPTAGPVPKAICFNCIKRCIEQQENATNEGKLRVKRESPFQVDLPCMEHRCHRTSPKKKKMSRNCPKSWNGENRVSGSLPLLAKNYS